MSEWIKCGEKMPEDYTEYLVVSDGQIGMANFRNGFFVPAFVAFHLAGSVDNVVMRKVSHYMPLPKPPEEDK